MFNVYTYVHTYITYTLCAHIYSTAQGNFTHTDRAHATYWLKARGFINPDWRVREGKPAKINF